VVGPVSAGLTARDGRQDLNEGTIEGGESMSDCISEWAWGLVARFRKEEGQALAEYGLILAFIAAVAVLALTALGLALAGQLNAFAAAFP
jgi:Flp pilus assembly pilin Flp